MRQQVDERGAGRKQRGCGDADGWSRQTHAEQMGAQHRDAGKQRNHEEGQSRPADQLEHRQEQRKAG